MSRKVYIDVAVRMIVNVEDDVDISELIGDMDYSFKSNSIGADIVDTEIVSHYIADSK